MRQLEPRLREGVRELLRVLVEAPRDLLVGRIEPQREVRRQHRRRDLLRRVVGVRDRAFTGAVLRLPLLRASRTRGQLPLVLEEVLEEVVAPLGRRRGPGDLETARDGVGSRCRFRSCSSSRNPAPRGCRPPVRGPTWVAGPAPWVLPNVCPPAMSATVSSSFIAMRRNVSRMSLAAATGSGLPFGPSGFT